MNDDGDRASADADNPFARPEQDLPAAITPDASLGRIAGWIFAVLGLLSLVNMVVAWSKGAVRLDIGAIAMLFIARGLLKRSNSARRWGIGCAGFYLVAMVIGGGVLWWIWGSGELDGRILATLPNAIVVLGIGAVLVVVFVALLWMLLHPRTRAAYQRRPREVRNRERSRTAAVRPRRRPPPPT